MITVPIEEVIERGVKRRPSGSGSVLSRALRMANVFANGLMLPSGPDASITPITATEFRATFGKDSGLRLDETMVRNEALMMVNVLSGIPSRLSADLSRLPIEKGARRVWYTRDAGYCELDPLASLLRLIGDVHIEDRLPLTPSELAEFEFVVVAAARHENPLPAQQQITEILKCVSSIAKPVIYLSGVDPRLLSGPPYVRCHRMPVQMPVLIDAIKGCQTESKNTKMRVQAA